jgi:hypothetical protein
MCLVGEAPQLGNRGFGDNLVVEPLQRLEEELANRDDGDQVGGRVRHAGWLPVLLRS